ncbi:MAG: response regulator transcription factor [Nitrospina sp.]|jgi:two-component system, OmpR family, alkaline phosphatase synthesis response regulator PhoP|nr:response regulator transcription factor [Nitrospina sp.]MBT3415470.1 response regulator transcription factor [Nitrospina sp.]MBT3855881.1 response regulator transcription factor [Nitrospina sp.]MBT4105118.1 response regulator transcription factor [Nitrospina sp.]MBT4389243.1 response regulator transcription factor [Nitrospina sp.]
MDTKDKKIIVVEDEAHLAKGLQFNLEREGYRVTLVDNGQSALDILGKEEFDLMILDIMLPKVSGLEVARRIRSTDMRFPILMLSAKSTDEDRELGLAAGADDYLTKPFHLPELLLRVKGILRRWEWYKEPVHDEEVFQFGDMWINFASGKAKGCSGEFYLTAKEALLIKLLVKNKGSIVTREELLEKVWGYDPQTETRTVDNFIARLRKYFEKKPQSPKHIITHREKGYEFKSDSKK